MISRTFNGTTGESGEGRMSGLSGADYHRLRAEAELERARQASDPKTAALHRQLAELHRLSAGDGETLEQTGHSLAPLDGEQAQAG